MPMIYAYSIVPGSKNPIESHKHTKREDQTRKLKESNYKLEIEKWYKEGRKLSMRSQLEEILIKKSGLPLYKLRILIDIYEGNDFRKRKSFKKIIDYFQNLNLIEKKGNQWIVSKKGNLLMIKLFPFLIKSLEWRPSMLFPEDSRVY